MKLNLQERNALRRLFSVEIDAVATVQHVREALAPLCGGKLAGILLFDGDEYLQNHERLEAYEIGDGATLNFEMRMCGPMPADYDWSQSLPKTKRVRI